MSEICYKAMNADELRDAFTSFYEKKGHLKQPSASLVPVNDPTLLFTSAGMVPFKPYFSNESKPPALRLTSVQKCFRTTDMENVGDGSHLTFFEMLGNFSFGDYFKKEACKWALELMTDVLKFNPDRLFYTVYTTDDSAFQCWRELGIEEKRIFRFGNEHNWWPPGGKEGPCGPCSELHVYVGEQSIDELSEEQIMHKLEQGDDFLEVYNLVFTQFDRQSDGSDKPLDSKNIDTGMGLERVLALMANVGTVYETEPMRYIMEEIDSLSDNSALEPKQYKRAQRIITDHIRAATFLLNDGVRPGRNGREYVLRRLIRRALRSATLLNLPENSLSQIASVVVAHMKSAYPEIETNLKAIGQALDTEERSTRRILETAPDIFNEVFKNILQKHAKLGESEQLKSKIAQKAFTLYDTYGLNFDTIAEIAETHGLSIEREGFESVLSQKRETQEGSQFQGNANMARICASLPPTEFVGYDDFGCEATVLAIFNEKDDTQLDSAKQSDGAVSVIFDKTPFYAERGGQVGDNGTIFMSNGNTELAMVQDAQSPYAHKTVHKVTIKHGILAVGQSVFLRIDVERRQKIMRNHTATHLIHAALRQKFGTKLKQSGSLVHPEYLRFDFNHDSPLSSDDITELQDMVNSKIRDGIDVTVHWTKLEQATKEGALSFFGERYEEDVRTIKIDAPWSYELCGGTHMQNTGGIGVFLITSQSGIGAGIRRIFATTGVGTEKQLQQLQNLASNLNVTLPQLSDKLEHLIKERDDARKAVAEQEKLYLKLVQDNVSNDQATDEQFDYVFSENIKIPIKMVLQTMSNMDMLRNFGDSVLAKMGTGVLVACSEIDGEPKLIVMVSKDLISQKVHAGNIAKELTRRLGGGGGGGPRLGQGGGSPTTNLREVVTQTTISDILDKLYG